MKKSSIPLFYGLYIAIGLIAYFLLLSLFGLHENPVYSVLNIFIVAGGMYAMIVKYRKEKGSKFKYQKGFGSLFTTGVVATVIFTAFFAIYATELNPDFITELVTMWETDWFVNIGLLVFTVALMGLATSVVLSLAYMQWFKKSRNTKEGQKHTY